MNGCVRIQVAVSVVATEPGFLMKVVRVLVETDVELLAKVHTHSSPVQALKNRFKDVEQHRAFWHQLRYALKCY